ncbi:hypothetical protein J2Y66_002483 [Paenarthrobacter nitroguajacolicus]|nr:hypothetical protein [Paenarthrobacter nitroguajacolicus]
MVLNVQAVPDRSGASFLEGRQDYMGEFSGTVFYVASNGLRYPSINTIHHMENATRISG